MGFISTDMINSNLGIGRENTVLDGMNDRYRFLEERSNYKRAVGKTLKQKTLFSPQALEKWLGIGKNPTLEAMGDYYMAQQGSTGSNIAVVNNNVIIAPEGKQGPVGPIGPRGLEGPQGLEGPRGPMGPKGERGAQGPQGIQGEKGKDADMKQVKEFIRRHKNYKNHVVKSNLLKYVKWGGLAALGIGAFFGIKALLDKNGEKETHVDSKTVATDSIPQDQNSVPAVDTRKLPLDEKGRYVAIKGDNFNTIAKRHLSDVYQNEPDSFVNLPNGQKENKITKETDRIIDINPKYEYDENHYYTKPALMVGDTINVE